MTIKQIDKMIENRGKGKIWSNLTQEDKRKIVLSMLKK